MLSDSDGPARPSRAHVLACNTGTRSQLASSSDRRRSSRDGLESPGVVRRRAGSRVSPCRQRWECTDQVLSARSPGKHSPRVQQLLSRNCFQEAWQQYMGRARAAQAHAVLAASAATAAAGFETTSSGSGATAAAGQQSRRTCASLGVDALAGLETRVAGMNQEAAGDWGPKGRHRKGSRGRHSALDPAGKVHQFALKACLRSAQIMPSTSCQTTLQAVHIVPGIGCKLAAAGSSATADALKAHLRSPWPCSSTKLWHPCQRHMLHTGHVGRITLQNVILP